MAVEGSFLRFGWDLGAFYRDEMSLRQFAVRVRALPYDSPLQAEMERIAEQAEQAEHQAAVDDALNRYRPGR